MHVQAGFGQQLLELGIPALKFTQPSGVGDVHAAELGASLVKSGLAEAAFAASLLDGHINLGLSDEPDDLLFFIYAIRPVVGLR